MSGLLVAVYDIAEEGVSMLDCEGSLITVEPIRSLSEMEPSGVSGFANLYLVQLSVTPTVSTPVLPIPVLVSISFPYYFCLPEHAKQ